MNLHDNYRLLSKFLLKGFGWRDSSSILLWEDWVEMQSKTSTAQATKMADNLMGAEDVHHQEPLSVCPSPFPVMKAEWKNMESICTNPVIHKPQKENLNSLTLGCLCCPRTAWLWRWPGVTFLPDHHFACRALVCEMPLHVKQSSLTYISSPKNNTPSTKDCVIEHLNTLKSVLKSCGKFKIFFLSDATFFCVRRLSIFMDGFLLPSKLLPVLLCPSLITMSQNFHRSY